MNPGKEVGGKEIRILLDWVVWDYRSLASHGGSGNIKEEVDLEDDR